ncbi:MAG: COQ9 family protein, partial [Erythrobacter cryptus]
MTTDFADMTLDELRVALAPDIAASAIFDGWNETALLAAAEMAGCDPDVARLAFPGEGAGGLAMEMIEAWITSVDQAMEAEWPAERLATMKIRERIRTLVAFRLDAVADVDEAVR